MTLDELKEQKIWFLWNYAPGKSGKTTKIPMSANGGITGTSDNFCNIWTDYDTAVTATELIFKILWLSRRQKVHWKKCSKIG